MNDKKIPKCIGFIMDGNRRWARAQGKSPLEGHVAGYEALKKMVDAVHRVGVAHMVCYAFSTENWKRTEEEVSYLMNLFSLALRELPEIHERENKKINIRIIGTRDAFNKDFQEGIAATEGRNIENPELTVWLALSYGSRAEIVSAVNSAIEKGEQVTEDRFSELLWTNGMPDPDLIIRTSGEKRLSNFLLWQAAYSEFVFTDTLWPDFGETEFESMLEEYATRDRRRGG